MDPDELIRLPNWMERFTNAINRHLDPYLDQLPRPLTIDNDADQFNSKLDYHHFQRLPTPERYEAAYYYVQKLAKTNPERAALVAVNLVSYVIYQRWGRVESLILQYPYAAAEYIAEVFHGQRWKEGERAIIKDPHAATYYAHYVLERRWKAAERYIKENPTIWKRYCIIFNIPNQCDQPNQP